ncbi:AGE family epimerase/isomerase [Leekyejoonella antrihumi]|uniref:N-acylglucosamine 2-epimerase n=1 Tax=Leekyejoonella antrihumi TaxID=1660198 RepID=A0A563E2D5_9MICO|nr:AGE family epimerase/isomerase [Leekyejoonella antrihumi]TWP36352.1 N-acylglucosamine 2-epimerase [Leekyejoonella antrihumi]
MPTQTSWTALESHRAWLDRGFTNVLWFVRGSIVPAGGFAYLDRNRRPMAGRTPELFLTARMVHTAALGHARGLPGCGGLLDHGLESLLGLFADTAHGGWFSRPEERTARKSTYDHVHVGLAASSAVALGHPLADRLMARVVEVVDTRLWDESAMALRESFASDWSDSEAYRGANANMHGLEAFLAMGRATGDAVWHERGLAIADRIINRNAREQGWLVPEHYDHDWHLLPDYNKDRPDDPFRPYGATPGHSVEWARLLIELHDSQLVHGPGWLVEAAEELAARALDDLWEADGRPGLVYTVDWDGRPVSTTRLHWPVCEAIQASASLYRTTGNWHWERWYRALWDHAAAFFIDAEGTWINELDDDMHEGGTVWPGRPDVYHCGGALTGPVLPRT